MRLWRERVECDRFALSMFGPIIAVVAIAGSTQAGTSVAFRTVARGTESRLDARDELVARTVSAWHVLWYKHRGTFDAPDIDLAREMVLAVFAGRQPTGGYALDIVSVTHEEGALVVRYRLRVVDAVRPPGEPQSTPFQIIAVPAERAKVRFLEIRDLGWPPLRTKGQRREPLS
jgi:hypothetical protein